MIVLFQEVILRDEKKMLIRENTLINNRIKFKR